MKEVNQLVLEMFGFCYAKQTNLSKGIFCFIYFLEMNHLEGMALVESLGILYY